MIPVLPLRLHYQLEQPAKLPAYLGSLWRSALGATLRRQVCITGANTCAGCPLITRCAYGFLFDTPQPASSDELTAQYKNLPHPYIISPRTAGGQHAAGATLTTDLIIVAPGQRFLPELLSASTRLRLGKVSATRTAIELLPPLADRDDDSQPITPAALLECKPRSPEPPPAPETATIVFEHALRLRRKNQYLQPDTLDFGTFFTTLMRRISMLHVLSQPHDPLATDFSVLAATARAITMPSRNLDWYDWSRRSARQQRRIPMGGITGSIHIRGALETLWPWLWLGQWLHVGKGAVMGNGRYRISTAP